MTDYCPLDQLLQHPREGTVPVSLVGGDYRGWRDWRSRVDQWRRLLTGEEGTTWALYHTDTYEFSAVLFALWASGKVACLPGSNQPLIVESLARRVDGFIGEFAADSYHHLVAPADQAPMAEEAPVALDDQALVVEVFTSGSSGEPQAIPKQLFQLRNEVDNLQRLWGDRIDGALVTATVSHQHIYGLLFRVLWPLAAGQCFDADLCEYLEDIMRRGPEWDRLLLISSPTHLSRIASGVDWRPLVNRCRGVFSSGAPLSQSASVATREALGQIPIEVYGSSETGGIAWRQQSAEREIPWQPVPGLTISLEPGSDCLRIRSPYLPPMGPDQWYATSDRAALTDDGGFQLRGRVDSIAKVEGKRVSLSEMEHHLLNHDWVAEAKLVVLEGKRTELGAVVELTPAGRARLEALGKRAVNTHLQERLRQQYERPVVPRRWRYPERLPYNQQGKLPRQCLLDLFAERS